MKIITLLTLSLLFSFLTIFGQEDTIEFVDPPTELNSQLDYTFTVRYTTAVERTLIFEFRKGTEGNALGFFRQDIPPATDENYEVTFNLDNKPVSGNDYILRTYIIEKGKTFRETVADTPDITSITMIVDVTEDRITAADVPQTLPSQNQYMFEVTYAATTDRDIVFEILNEGQVAASGRTAVVRSDGTALITVQSENPLPEGNSYTYRFYLTITGGTFTDATATGDLIGNVAVVGSLGDVCTEVYEEKEGVLLIEAENMDISGTMWQRKIDKPGYTGTSYIEWTGPDRFGQPGTAGVLDIKIKINNPGKYQFQWRNAVGKGQSTTEHNDSWLKFDLNEVADFYGEKPDGSRTYPRGTGRTPNPEGASGDGWFKLYVNNLNWQFSGRTGDNADGRSVFVEFDTAGDYTMQISGRSANHLIDRVALYKVENAGTALDTSSPTVCEPEPLSTYTATLAEQGIFVYPIPVQDVLTIQGLKDQAQFLLRDAKGSLVFQKELHPSTDATLLLPALTPGLYFGYITDKGSVKIIVEY